jgi:hypothetical protein
MHALPSNSPHRPLHLPPSVPRPPPRDRATLLHATPQHTTDSRRKVSNLASSSFYGSTAGPSSRPKDLDSLISETKTMKRVLSKVTLERFRTGEHVGASHTSLPPPPSRPLQCEPIILTCPFPLPCTSEGCAADRTAGGISLHGSPLSAGCRRPWFLSRACKLCGCKLCGCECAWQTPGTRLERQTRWAGWG